MPPYKVPTRSGVHRLACLSLYRALLSACSPLPASDPKFDGLRRLVQTQFRQKRVLRSPSQISKCLKAGYEALDLLDSCSHGNPESIDKLETLRQETQTLTEFIRTKQRALAAVNTSDDTPPPTKQSTGALQHNVSLEPHPDREPILSRPRPKVPGRRRVPVLVNAGGLPYLRIKKPQPRILNFVIKSKLETRWRRIQRRERLQVELEMARAEDRWDKIVGEADPESWTVPILTSLWEVNKMIEQADNNTARLAKSMWEVVLKERELAEKEKNEMKALKNKQKAARREAKRASGDADNGSHENAVADGSHRDSSQTV